MSKNKVTKLLLAMAVSSGLFINYTSGNVHATQLSDAYTGEEILQHAKDTYDSLGYEDVDTCTGLVSHVFYEDLKVPNGLEIIGPRVFVGYGREPYNGYLTRYNPNSMMDNAERLVAEGRAIRVYEGSARGVYNSEIPIRDGDIVFTTREEMGAQYGHVAIMENKMDEEGTIGWWGAHGPANTKDQEVSYQPFARTNDDRKNSNPSYFPGYFTGTVHIYRVVDYATPSIKTDVETTREVTYSLSATKLDEETGKPVEGVEVEFIYGGKSVKDVTDENGIAKYTESKTLELNPEDYRYITNYDKISPEDKEKVDAEGLYKSLDEAQKACDEKLKELSSIEEPDFSSVEVRDLESNINQTLETTDNKDNSLQLEVEDIHITKQNVKVIGLASGAKCQVLDKNGKVIEEFITSELGYGTVGYIVKGLTSDETYTLREVSEPNGYIKSNDIEFTVNGSDGVYLNEKPVLGTLNVTIMGDVFKKAENNKLIYENSKLENIPLTLYAKEDITIGTKIVYSKGQEVATTTNNQFTNLPVGHYYFIASEYQDGYVKSGKKYDVTITNEEGIADPVYEQEIHLDSQVFNISVKNLIDSGDISADDIVIVKNKEGIGFESTISSEGMLVQSLDNKLPVGEYTLAVRDSKFNLTFSVDYKDSSVTNYTMYLGNDSNNKGKITAKVVDENNKPLKNVELVLASDIDFENVLETVKTNKEGIIEFDNIDLGTYYIKQTRSSEVYATAKDIITIELSPTFTNVEISFINKSTDVIIDSKDLGGVLNVAGIELELYDSTGDLIDKWTTDKMSHVISGLSEGSTYTLLAKESAKGYKKPATTEFTVSDGLMVTVKSRAISDGFTSEGINTYNFGTWVSLLIIAVFALLMYRSSPWKSPLLKSKINHYLKTAH